MSVAQIPVAVDDYRSAGRAGDGTLVLTGSPNPGDLQILAGWSDNGTQSITTAGGGSWTALTGSPFSGPGSEKLYVWWRIAQSGDSNPTITVASSTPTTSSHFLQLMEYADGSFDTSTPIDAISSAASGTTSAGTPSGTLNSITTTVANARLLAIIGRGSNTPVNAVTQTSQTYGELVDTGTTSGDDSHIAFTESTKATAGATAAGSISLTNATDPWVIVSIAIRPRTVTGDVTHVSWAAAMAADAPRNWWKFDEPSGTTATDSGGTPTNGTYAGGPTLAASKVLANGSGSAVTLDGVDDEMSVAVTVPAVFTLESWIDDWSTGSTDVLLRDNTGSSGWILFWINASQFQTRIQNSTNLVPNLANQVGTTPKDGNRHHLVVQKTGTFVGGIRLFLDGVLIAAGTSSATSASTSPLHFGRNGTVSAFTPYKQDDAVIYASALAITKIVAHYEAGIATAQTIAPTAASSTPTAGTPTLGHATPQTVVPTAASSTPTANTPTLGHATPQTITPTAASSTPTANTPTLSAASLHPTAATSTPTANDVELANATPQTVAPTAASSTPTAYTVTLVPVHILTPGAATSTPTAGDVVLTGEPIPPIPDEGRPRTTPPPVPAAFRAAWQSRQTIGTLKPQMVVEIRRGRWQRGTFELADVDDQVNADIPDETRAKPWLCYWEPAEDWVEVPGVGEAVISSSFDQNGLPTARVTVENTRLSEQTGSTGMQYHTIERGYLAPERGYDDPDRGLAGGTANEWQGRLSRMAQIRIWQGYGAPDRDEDGAMPTLGGNTGGWAFVGFIDDVDLTDLPDRAVVTARCGQQLTDQLLFGWNKSKQLKDPVTFDATSKATGKRWVDADDFSDVVRVVLRWAGYLGWDVEDTGVTDFGHRTFGRDSFLIDVIKTVEDETGFVFFFGQAPDGESPGLPVFRREATLIADPDLLFEATEDDFLTAVDSKESTEDLRYIIRVRGKEDEDDGRPLGGDSTNRLMAVYRPPWSYQPHEGGDDRLAGEIRHGFLQRNDLKTIEACEVMARLIALREAQVSTTATVTVPGHFALALDQVIGVEDSATAINSRLWITQFESTFQTGTETHWTSQITGALLDTADVKAIVDQIGEIVAGGSGGIGGTPAPTAPAATTSSASNVTPTSAEMRAIVNPGSQPTTYYFEYGTTTAYGTQTTPASAGSGSDPLTFEAPLTGLSDGTTYHYRVVATNDSGVTTGEDQTFVAEAATLGVELVELVTAGSVADSANGGNDWGGHTNRVVRTALGVFTVYLLPQTSGDPNTQRRFALAYRHSDGSGWSEIATGVCGRDTPYLLALPSGELWIIAFPNGQLHTWNGTPAASGTSATITLTGADRLSHWYTPLWASYYGAGIGSDGSIYVFQAVGGAPSLTAEWRWARRSPDGTWTAKPTVTLPDNTRFAYLYVLPDESGSGLSVIGTRDNLGSVLGYPATDTYFFDAVTLSRTADATASTPSWTHTMIAQEDYSSGFPNPVAYAAQSGGMADPDGRVHVSYWQQGDSTSGASTYRRKVRKADGTVVGPGSFSPGSGFHHHITNAAGDVFIVSYGGGSSVNFKVWEIADPDAGTVGTVTALDAVFAIGGPGIMPAHYQAGQERSDAVDCVFANGGSVYYMKLGLSS